MFSLVNIYIRLQPLGRVSECTFILRKHSCLSKLFRFKFICLSKNIFKDIRVTVWTSWENIMNIGTCCISVDKKHKGTTLELMASSSKWPPFCTFSYSTHVATKNYQTVIETGFFSIQIMCVYFFLGLSEGEMNKK